MKVQALTILVVLFMLVVAAVTYQLTIVYCCILVPLGMMFLKNIIG